MKQVELEFPTSSPINFEKLSGQNKRLFEFLMTGESIHLFHPAKKELKIGFLNSRKSDLANKFDIPIQSEYISVEGTTVIKYWIDPTDIEKLKNYV